MLDYYILKDGPQPRETIQATTEEWILWWTSHADQRRVAQDSILTSKGLANVSTVFLSLDHGWDGQVLLFETMIFPDGSWLEQYCERYATEAEALDGHHRIVENLLVNQKPDSQL